MGGRIPVIGMQWVLRGVWGCIILFFFRKVINTIALHRGRAHFLKSTEVVSNEGDQYYKIATDAKVYLESKGVRVVAVVGDNASGVQNGLKGFLALLKFRPKGQNFVF